MRRRRWRNILKADCRLRKHKNRTKKKKRTKERKKDNRYPRINGTG